MSSEKKKFASVLDSLRAAEDVFYFSIDSGQQSGTRIALEGEVTETPIGLDDLGNIGSESSVTVLCALVRKDWGGVHVIPRGEGTVSLNGEAIVSSHRLRHGDYLQLGVRVKGNHAPVDSTLVFHEPTLLQLIPEVFSPGPARDADQAIDAPQASPKLAKSPRTGKVVFGLFRLKEIAWMVILVLLGAVVIFLLLNLLQDYFR